MPRHKKGLQAKRLTAAEKAVYQQWIDGTSTLTNRRTPSGDSLKRYQVGIVPFSFPIPSSGNPHVSCSATKQALSILKGNFAIGATEISGSFGHEYDPTKIADAPAGFYPALAKVSIFDPTANKTEHTSFMTGRKRKDRNRRSGSIPFGRGTVTKQTAGAGSEANAAIKDIEYTEAKKAVENAFKTATLTGLSYNLSFEAEVIRATAPQPAALGATTLSSVTI